MAKFKIETDLTACQGFGACVELCSKFFKLSNGDGKTRIKGANKLREGDEVVGETLELDDLLCIREAGEACPFNAIHITDIETGEKLI